MAAVHTAVSLRETNNQMGTVFDFCFLLDLHSALLGNEISEGLGVGHRVVLRRRRPPHGVAQEREEAAAPEGTTSRMMSRVICVSQSTQ